MQSCSKWGQSLNDLNSSTFVTRYAVPFRVKNEPRLVWHYQWSAGTSPPSRQGHFQVRLKSLGRFFSDVAPRGALLWGKTVSPWFFDPQKNYGELKLPLAPNIFPPLPDTFGFSNLIQQWHNLTQWEYPQKIWPKIWYSTSILGSWNSHWTTQQFPWFISHRPGVPESRMFRAIQMRCWKMGGRFRGEKKTSTDGDSISGWIPSMGGYKKSPTKMLLVFHGFSTCLKSI